MTSVVFTLKGLDGNPITSTQFKIEAAAPDGVPDPLHPVPAHVLINTNASGVATATLTATGAPYYLTRVSGTTDDLIAFKFFVPASDVALNLDVLYVDLGRHLKVSTDRAIYTLIETKVSMLNALNIAKAYQENVLATIAGISVDVAGVAATAISGHNAATDPHGDRAYVDGLLAAMDSVPMANHVHRRTKFGNHTDFTVSVPNCPYQSRYESTQAVVSAYELSTLTNSANVVDCAHLQLISSTANESACLTLYGKDHTVTTAQQHWTTGSDLQAILSVALSGTLPTGDYFSYRIGLSDGNRSGVVMYNPFYVYPPEAGATRTGCSALFVLNSSSLYWQCMSGRGANAETTVTTVLGELDKFTTFHVRVTATGNVEFRINGTLVATHSGIGKIPNGAFLSESLGVVNFATTAATAKGFYIDEIAYLHQLPSSRAGMVFV